MRLIGRMFQPTKNQARGVSEDNREGGTPATSPTTWSPASGKEAIQRPPQTQEMAFYAMRATDDSMLGPESCDIDRVRSYPHRKFGAPVIEELSS